MDPNQQPTENPNPETIQPTPTSPVVQPTEPELTNQVDDMMATSSTGAAPAPPPPAEPVTPVEPVADQTASTGSNGASKRGWKKPVLIGAVVVAVLAALAGAAYAEIIVPNKPENVLKSALENTLQAKQLTYKANVDVTDNGSAIKADISGAQDNDKHASDVTLNATYTGITLPIEARLVDKNIYVKAGDLTPLASLATAYSPELGKVAKSVSAQLSNKWIAIDSTLLKSSGASCVTDANFALTQADIQMLEDQYSKHPFALIKSTASDTVDGVAATKYDLSINDDTAAVFGNSLDNLSVVKALNACTKDTAKSKTTTGDHDTTPLTVWVDKKTKHIVKVAAKSTDKDAKKGTTGTASVTLKYEPVSITAPTNSTPALEVLANLEQSLGLNSSSASGLDLTSLLSGLGQ